MVLKPLKIRPPGTFCLIILQPDHFSKFQKFDQLAIDAKNVLTFEKCPLLAELKMKMSQTVQFFMFSISALPQEGSFHMLTHF